MWGAWEFVSDAAREGTPDGAAREDNRDVARAGTSDGAVAGTSDAAREDNPDVARAGTSDAAREDNPDVARAGTPDGAGADNPDAAVSCADKARYSELIRKQITGAYVGDSGADKARYSELVRKPSPGASVGDSAQRDPTAPNNIFTSSKVARFDVKHEVDIVGSMGSACVRACWTMACCACLVHEKCHAMPAQAGPSSIRQGCYGAFLRNLWIPFARGVRASCCGCCGGLTGPVADSLLLLVPAESASKQSTDLHSHELDQKTPRVLIMPHGTEGLKESQTAIELDRSKVIVHKVGASPIVKLVVSPDPTKTGPLRVVHSLTTETPQAADALQQLLQRVLSGRPYGKFAGMRIMGNCQPRVITLSRKIEGHDDLCCLPIGRLEPSALLLLLNETRPPTTNSRRASDGRNEVHDAKDLTRKVYKPAIARLNHRTAAAGLVARLRNPRELVRTLPFVVPGASASEDKAVRMLLLTWSYQFSPPRFLPMDHFVAVPGLTDFKNTIVNALNLALLAFTTAHATCQRLYDALVQQEEQLSDPKEDQPSGSKADYVFQSLQKLTLQHNATDGSSPTQAELTALAQTWAMLDATNDRLARMVLLFLTALVRTCIAVGHLFLSSTETPHAFDDMFGSSTTNRLLKVVTEKALEFNLELTPATVSIDPRSFCSPPAFLVGNSLLSEAQSQDPEAVGEAGGVDDPDERGGLADFQEIGTNELLRDFDLITFLAQAVPDNDSTLLPAANWYARVFRLASITLNGNDATRFMSLSQVVSLGTSESEAQVWTSSTLLRAFKEMTTFKKDGSLWRNGSPFNRTLRYASKITMSRISVSPKSTETLVNRTALAAALLLSVADYFPPRDDLGDGQVLGGRGRPGTVAGNAGSDSVEEDLEGGNRAGTARADAGDGGPQYREAGQDEEEKAPEDQRTAAKVDSSLLTAEDQQALLGIPTEMNGTIRMCST